MFLLTEILLISIIQFCTQSSVINHNNRQHGKQLQAIFWQIKPYIFWDEKTQKMDGIYPLIFRKGAEYCTPSSKNPLIDYKLDFGSRDKLDRVMRSNLSYGKREMRDITTDKAVLWGPYDQNIGKIRPDHFLRRNLTMLNLASSGKLVVIQPRQRISLPNKILRGISYCNLIIVISFILCLFFGMLIWICERNVNPHFRSVTGPWAGLYWSFVTMTTVGYGDVTPVSLIGRIISVAWMFMGLMVASVMTATLTNVVTGVEGLGIEGKKVAVMRDSHEEYFVKRDYFAHPLLYDSFEKVVQAVRDEDVYAAVLPYDIAAWMQEEIRGDHDQLPLSIVETIGGNVPFPIFIGKDPFPGSQELLDCMLLTYKHEVVTTSEQVYKRHIKIETTYYGYLYEAFLHNSIVQCVSAMTALLIGVVVLLLRQTKKHGLLKESNRKENIEDCLWKISSLINEYNMLVKEEKGGHLEGIKPFAI